MHTTLSRSLLNLGDQLTSLVRARLWLQVVIGMVLGIATGILIGPDSGLVEENTASLIANWVALPGQLFLLSIQFVVIPLVVASVIRGICAGQGSTNLGRLGGWTVAFFLSTTIVAVLLGVSLALLVDPGRLIDGEAMSAALGGAKASATPADVPGVGDLPGVITTLFPRDPLASFVSG